MEYQLPTNWGRMTLNEKMLWHEKRIKREAPIYDWLAEQRILTTLRDEEVLDRLERVRYLKSRVEAALLLNDNAEFMDLKGVIEQKANAARELIRERARILTLQFRRKSIKDQGDEKQVLLTLKNKTEQAIKEVEILEIRIKEICGQYKTDPSPYLKSKQLRS